MKLVLITRKPHQFHYSIESVFYTLSKYFPKWIQFRFKVLKFNSIGIIPRVLNIIDTAFDQAQVNHITGDIYYTALLLRKKRTILTVHDCGFVYSSTGIKRFILLWLWLKLPVYRSGTITTISETTKSDLISLTGCSENKIKVIPNFVNPSIVFYKKEFNSIEPVILQIGTKKNKNIVRLLASIKDFNCHLWIVGQYRKEYELLLEKYQIKYTWFQNLSEPDLMFKYLNCDLLTFVSTLEGFGLPILEAQATGRPVITSNLSAMPEVAGEGACLVDPYDVDSIKNGILRVIVDANYRNDLIQKGLQNAKKFSVESVAEQYIQIYKQIASNEI